LGFDKAGRWIERSVGCEVVDGSFPAHQKMWVTEHGPQPDYALRSYM